MFQEVHYQSRIMNQRVVHYENDYIDFGVRYFGDEGTPYFILKDDITPYNDLDVSKLTVKLVKKKKKIITFESCYPETNRRYCSTPESTTTRPTTS